MHEPESDLSYQQVRQGNVGKAEFGSISGLIEGEVHDQEDETKVKDRQEDEFPVHAVSELQPDFDQVNKSQQNGSQEHGRVLS